MLPEPRGPFGTVRSPLANLRGFVFFFVVASITFVGFDVVLEGPISGCFWTMAIPGVDRSWGFSAEHRALCGGRWLVVTSVAPNGPFDRAGIKPGNAVSLPGKGHKGEFGVYRLLSSSNESAELWVYRDPVHWCDTREVPSRIVVTEH